MRLAKQCRRGLRLNVLNEPLYYNRSFLEKVFK